MSITLFPDATHVSIDDRGTIAAIEDLFAAIVGLITATGGSFAIAGRDVLDTPLAERARLLTGMYDAGEVVVGYADARNGDVVNIVIEHLMLCAPGGPPQPCWRALVYVEEPMGHELRGAIASHRWPDVGQRLFAAVSDGLRQPLPTQRAAMARLMQGAA